MTLAGIPIRLVDATVEEHVENLTLRLTMLDCSPEYVKKALAAEAKRGYVNDDGWTTYLQSLRARS